MMEQEEEKEEESKIIKTVESKDKFIKVIAYIVGGVALLSLIIYKISHPEFSFIGVLLLGTVILIIGVAIYYIADIIHYFKNKDKKEDDDKLPKAATQEEMIEIARQILIKSKIDGGGENHIKSIADRKAAIIGGNTMFHLSIIPLYNEGVINTIDFVFNAHFPQNPRIGYNLNFKQVNETLNRLSFNPDSKPDVERSVTIDPLTGRQTEYVKTTTHKKKKIKKEEEDDV